MVGRRRFYQITHSFANSFVSKILKHSSFLIEFSSIAQSCLTLCDPMNRQASLSVTNSWNLPKHVHWVGDAIQPSPPALNLFKWISSLYQVAKVLEFQLQHESFQLSESGVLKRKSAWQARCDPFSGTYCTGWGPEVTCCEENRRGPEASSVWSFTSPSTYLGREEGGEGIWGLSIRPPNPHKQLLRGNT